MRREKFPEDRRRVTAVITDDGHMVAREATVAYARGVQTHLLGSLSPAQIVTIEENCRRINTALQRSEHMA